MARRCPLYPLSPRNVPGEITALSARYRLQVLIVLSGLFFFFFLYLGLVAGSAYLCYRCFAPRSAEQARQKGVQPQPPARSSSANAGRYYNSRSAPRKTEWDGWSLIVGILSGLLCLFLVKGFFKWRRSGPARQFEITAADHPQLFAFIADLCAETRAPLPHRVYVSPEVNACVFYNSSILSLFWPTPKNLLIGLGLVNVLNLTEFKSVLAHEFGHFSQKSMRLGGYVYVSQRIMADIVYGRDWLDDLLDGWCRLDIRLAVFGWGFKGVLWGLRKGLAGLFQGITFLHSAMSRQMEFNADRVAVSVTGSDAPAHVLARLGFADESLRQARSDLQTAADHRVYSNDLFYHHSQAAAYLRQLRKDPHLGEPPPLPADPAEVPYLFEPGEQGIPLMWATHPTNYERERSAKATYLRSEFDERSPWLLFDGAPALRQQVTRQLNHTVFKAPEGATFADAHEVQAFIDDEHAEMAYHPRYHGLYDGRIIEPGDVSELVRAASAESWDRGTLARAQALLYGDEMTGWLEGHNDRLKEYDLLLGVSRGFVKPVGGTVEFRGRSYRPQEAESLLREVDGELAEDQRWLANLDRKVFLTHYRMAQQVDDAAARELAERYRFHIGVQSFFRELMSRQHSVQATLQWLSGQRQVQAEDFQQALATFRDAHRALADCLRQSRELVLPPLKNMKAGQPLRDFLLEKKLIYELTPGDKTIEGDWVSAFLEQLGEVLDKVRRLHFKGLGGILSLQERINEQLLACQEPVAVVLPATTHDPATPG
jgi:Zn-dependent protease with chaperone function